MINDTSIKFGRWFELGIEDSYDLQWLYAFYTGTTMPINMINYCVRRWLDRQYYIDQ